MKSVSMQTLHRELKLKTSKCCKKFQEDAHSTVRALRILFAKKERDQDGRFVWRGETEKTSHAIRPSLQPYTFCHLTVVVILYKTVLHAPVLLLFFNMNQHCSLQHLVSCLLFLCDRLGWRIRTWVLLQPGKGSPESCRKLSISISHNGGTVQSVFQGSILHPTVNPNTHTTAPVSSFEKEGTLAAAWLFCVQEANTLESNGFFIHQVNVSRRFGCTPACI